MEWKQATKTDTSATIPERWIHLHYYEALNMLFRIENALRVFVYCVLKTELGSGWQGLNISVEDDDAQKTIGAIAKKRVAQSQAFGYLGHAVTCPVMHLTSGELSKLITSDSYWKHFKSYFPASKDVVSTKFEEIGTIRNSLAHFRPVRPDDVDVIRQNSKQVLDGVEHYLQQVMAQPDVVPTNTTEEWYVQIKGLTDQCCQSSFNQAKDGDPIRIVLEYLCPILRSRGTSPDSRYANYLMLVPWSSEILQLYEAIRTNALYLSETVRWLGDRAPTQEPQVSKSMHLVIPRRGLLANHAALAADIKALLAKMHEETELIKGDNLARGSLIQPVWVSATGKEKEGSPGEVGWKWETGGMLTPVQPENPPEYWGNFVWTGWGDFVAGTSQYPWMPGLVSDLDFGF
jgi:hypothetical protein